MTIRDLYILFANHLMTDAAANDFLKKEIYIDSNGLGMQPLNTVHVLSDTGNLLLAFVPPESEDMDEQSMPF